MDFTCTTSHRTVRAVGPFSQTAWLYVLNVIRIFTVELRQWQKECLDDFIKARNRNESIFVFEACPGAGKSMMAAELSWQMLNDEENRIDVVIVVVPWTTIQGHESSGMIKTFDRRGLLTRDRLMIRGARIVSDHEQGDP